MVIVLVEKEKKMAKDGRDWNSIVFGLSLLR